MRAACISYSQKTGFDISDLQSNRWATGYIMESTMFVTCSLGLARLKWPLRPSAVRWRFAAWKSAFRKDYRSFEPDFAIQVADFIFNALFRHYPQIAHYLSA